MRSPLALLLMCSSLLVACGGGGSGGSVTPIPSAGAPTPTPIPTAAPVSIPVGSAPASASLGSVSGASGSLSVPAAASGSGSVTAQLVAGQPAGTPVLQSTARLPRAIGSSQLTPIVFVAFTPAATLAFAQTPSFSFVFPAGFALVSGAQAYIALYDPTQAALGWQTFLGPGTVSGSSATGITIVFSPVARSATFQANQTYVFVLFATAATINAAPTPSPSPSPPPVATASPTSTPATGPLTGFACPTNTQTGAVARSAQTVGTDAVHRRAHEHGTSSDDNLLAVAYDRGVEQSNRRTIAANEAGLGAMLVQSYDFPHTNTAIRLIAVPVGQMTAVAAQLRAQSGVRSVAPAGGHRYATTVAAPYFPNDPYFNGFTASQNSTAGNPAASTFQVGPYEESAKVPGQWDMHAVGLGNAFAYAQSGNTVAANANALGSTAIKLAVIDTGVDPNHPELAGKIVRQQCFITGSDNVQSTSSFATDPMGHGTDVAGIAAAAVGNGVGFAGAGGAVSIMAYRVFPTPDDSCVSDNSSDDRCGADTRDIASAIADAVANGANVINMSLGGGTCGSGLAFARNGDPDVVEGAAVAEAVAANVVVVAAAGNDGQAAVDAPGCDSGVIAAGATGLADGQLNGAGNSNGSAGSPSEYVASYSDWSPGSSVHSASAWGIVAPGGDPAGDNDNDGLHWIENIWTSTPYMSSPGDQSFAGNCNSDYAVAGGTTDCRTLIAGTSMASPHVAGAAALILSVNPSYQSSPAMKQLLCQTAHDIGDAHQGCGRLNLYRAMAVALGDGTLPSI